MKQAHSPESRTSWTPVACRCSRSWARWRDRCPARPSRLEIQRSPAWWRSDLDRISAPRSGCRQMDLWTAPVPGSRSTDTRAESREPRRRRTRGWSRVEGSCTWRKGGINLWASVARLRFTWCRDRRPIPCRWCSKIAPRLCCRRLSTSWDTSALTRSAKDKFYICLEPVDACDI